MNYTQRLPNEMLKKTLYNLTVKDIINYCRTNEDAQKLCQDNTFCKLKSTIVERIYGKKL